MFALQNLKTLYETKDHILQNEKQIFSLDQKEIAGCDILIKSQDEKDVKENDYAHRIEKDYYLTLLTIVCKDSKTLPMVSIIITFTSCLQRLVQQ